MTFRPIWNRDHPPEEKKDELFERLAALEQRGRDVVENLIKAVSILGCDVDNVSRIADQAVTDIVAGADLARHGYAKQALTLMRSWYEQAFFVLYFLEAPLHRLAWVQEPEINFGHRPKSPLMLHQFFTTGRDPHPFAVAYKIRLDNLFLRLKLQLSNKQEPATVAEACLTDLSKGVHGTYSPTTPRTDADVAKALLPVNELLERSVMSYAAFITAYVVDIGDVDDQRLLELRNGSRKDDPIDSVFVEFRHWLSSLSTKRGNRG
ncbi:MAG TPA: hypothetical protein VF493_01530 [Terriglobales bacterium]